MPLASVDMLQGSTKMDRLDEPRVTEAVFVGGEQAGSRQELGDPATRPKLKVYAERLGAEGKSTRCETRLSCAKFTS